MSDGIFDGISRNFPALRKNIPTLAKELEMSKLTATGVRNAGAAAKSYKLADGGGLYLFVNTKGARY